MNCSSVQFGKLIRMEKIVGIICLVFLAFAGNAANEKIIESKIKNVTVYSQGAQIYRSASYNVGKGITEIVIEGVSPRIDANSLQVKATGNVIILDSKYSLFYPEPEKKPLSGIPLKIRRQIDLLMDSLENMDYKIMEVQDQIAVLSATKNILSNNGAIRGQGKVNDSIPLLKEAIEYYTIKMNEINVKLMKLKRGKNKLSKERKGMDKRLTDLRNYQNNAGLNPKPKGPTHRLTITVSAKEYAKGKLNVSYLVSQAGWVPLYDLRSEIQGKKVNLNYKAQVYQNTGIDWDNVRLSISTNNPYQNKTKPTLHPWYVDYFIYNRPRATYKKDKYSEKLKQRAESMGYNNAPAPTTADAEMDELAISQTADQFVEVVDHVISAEFKIDLPYTIKSNNEQHMVLVKNQDLSAEFKYFAVPKYDRGVFLVAQITKLDELQLVPAKANIFFDGSYIGETYLDPTSMDDTLDLSLGKDPNIIVKRTLLKKEVKEKVIGAKVEKTKAYSIEVKNLKSTNIEIVIQDQIPVTRNAEIEIDPIELSRGSHDKRTGIIEWKFNLKPKGKKDLIMKYKIKHDKDKNVPLS